MFDFVVQNWQIDTSRYLTKLQDNLGKRKKEKGITYDGTYVTLTV